MWPANWKEHIFIEKPPQSFILVASDPVSQSSRWGLLNDFWIWYLCPQLQLENCVLFYSWIHIWRVFTQWTRLTQRLPLPLLLTRAHMWQAKSTADKCAFPFPTWAVLCSFRSSTIWLFRSPPQTRAIPRAWAQNLSRKQSSLHLDECVSAEVEADIPTISDSLEGWFWRPIFS